MTSILFAAIVARSTSDLDQLFFYITREHRRVDGTPNKNDQICTFGAGLDGADVVELRHRALWAMPRLAQMDFAFH